MELNLCMGCMNQKTGQGPCPYCGFREEGYVASPRHLPLGTILNGKYLAGRALGEGGFGITYMGYDLDLGMKLAVKEYYPNELVTRENSQSNRLVMMTGKKDGVFQNEKGKFLEEARCLAKFWGLPGIVAVKDFFQENGTAYIVMEFVEGKTLEQMLEQRGGTMEPGQVLKLLDPVMASLETIHQSGLIHRDISPDNIMVSPDNRCKLIDFGAARDFTAEGREMSVILRPRYAPWEQYGGRGQQGPWTDVYALCATIYRAVTGRKPDDIMSRAEEDRLKRPSELGVRMPDYQEAALMKGLALYAPNRFQSVGELREAFQAPQSQQAADPTGLRADARREDTYRPEAAARQGAMGQQPPAPPQGSVDPGKGKPSKGMWLGLGAAVITCMAIGIGVVTLVTYSLLSAWSGGKEGDGAPLPASAEAEPSIESSQEEESFQGEAEEAAKATVATEEVLATTAPSVPAITINDITSVVASSSLSEYNMTHSPSRLMDGDLATAWVEGAAGQGQGESVTFMFRGERQVSGFCINAGYQKSLDLYQKNSRPAMLRVSYPAGASESYPLADVFAMQDIPLKEPVVASQITFTIESVYPGGKYEDTVISELTLY